MRGHVFTRALASIAVLTVTACTCTSGGLELGLEGGEERSDATVSWQSSDDVSGNMTTSLADGRVFNGPYFKITAETKVDRLAALWDGWAADAGWEHWKPGPSFVRQYDGKILAGLSAASADLLALMARHGVEVADLPSI